MKFGPTLRVLVECHGCTHAISEYYCVEDGNDCDSGFKHYCGHFGRRYVGLDDKTPEWCPFYPSALLASLTDTKETP